MFIGLKLSFCGSSENSMRGLDHPGGTVAIAGSISEIPVSGETIRMAVHAVMDVALMVCALLCIQHMM